MKSFKLDNKGITLIELILTLAILAIVIQVIYSIYFVGNKSFKVSKDIGFAQQDVRLGTEYLSNELKFIDNIYIISPPPDSYKTYYSLEIISNRDGSYYLEKTEYVDDLIDESSVKRIYGSWNEIIIEMTDDNPGLINTIMIQNKSNNELYKVNVSIALENKRNLKKELKISSTELESKKIYYSFKEYRLTDSDVDNTPVGTEPIIGSSVSFYTLDSNDLPYHIVTGKIGSRIKMPDVPNSYESNNDNFIFSGWYTKTGGMGTEYNNDSTFPTTDMPLYANWEKMIKVNFYTGNNNESIYFAITGKNGDKINMPSDPIKENSKFSGWNTKKDGSGNRYSHNSIFPSANLNLYSKWDSYNEDNWIKDKRYNANDEVIHKGSRFKAKKATHNEEPSTNDWSWQEITDQWRWFNSYKTDDIVFYKENQFRAKKATTNEEPGINDWSWQEITDQWRWFNSYKLGDIVIYNGKEYKAKRDTKNENPLTTDYAWQSLS